MNINCRVGGGFWRRGGETPSPVKWEDRIIEIREGSWSYVAGSIGRAPGMLYKLIKDTINIKVIEKLSFLLCVSFV